MTLQEASEFLEEKGVAAARTFLRSAREHAKVSQLELSKLSGVPQPNLNRIESGKGFTARTFVRLYNAIEERIIANHRAAELAVEMWDKSLGIDRQSPEYQRQLVESARIVDEWDAVEALVKEHLGETATAKALSEELNLRVVIPLQRHTKEVEQERDALRASLFGLCGQMSDWFGNLEKNLLSAQELNREEVAELAGGLKQVREQLLGIRAKEQSK